MNHSDYKTILHKKNLKATKPRLAVLDVLARQKSPIDIEAIKESLGKSCPNNVTIYRMMEDLSCAGIVRQIDLRQGRAFFELMPHDDHHHIVCVSCKKVEDIPGCVLKEEIERVVEKSTSFDRSIDHVFEVFALCTSCKE